ncbi:L-rhamnose mutarotase [Lachnoclostridium sp. Marseille-P6806]|uniref:L-rhamnose mutarotase n=1 Tax=Lachnoclostridium sp. Marseille-P6806 TaxID=2364793 RepID=UPI001031E54A|nr:L-rhamnose mutarotase [Lachnoclostridium sp. Marseille-P6806]
MERYTFALQLRPGCFSSFRTGLGELWEAVTGTLDEMGAGNFSIWSAAGLVFGYYEIYEDTSRKKRPPGPCGAGSERENSAFAWGGKRLKELFDQKNSCFRWICAPDSRMRLMYEDFGIVRESKELIRHRVFVTKLKPGMREEYKRRHDGLAAARGGRPDPGPDSNFSIWNAEDYIFGYDEIDTSMEKEETADSRAEVLAWETGMLDIMSWITDDVDWITGERHARVTRIGFHSGAAGSGVQAQA